MIGEMTKTTNWILHFRMVEVICVWVQRVEHILLAIVPTQCRTFFYLFCYNFRRRTHACSFWGTNILGVRRLWLLSGTTNLLILYRSCAASPKKLSPKWKSSVRWRARELCFSSALFLRLLRYGFFQTGFLFIFSTHHITFLGIAYTRNVYWWEGESCCY